RAFRAWSQALSSSHSTAGKVCEDPIDLQEVRPATVLEVTSERTTLRATVVTDDVLAALAGGGVVIGGGRRAVRVRTANGLATFVHDAAGTVPRAIGVPGGPDLGAFGIVPGGRVRGDGERVALSDMVTVDVGVARHSTTLLAP